MTAGLGEGAVTEIPTRGKSLCPASAASFAHPVGMGAAAVPSAQPLFPEGSGPGAVVSQSSLGLVIVFPLQSSVLRKRKAHLPAPFLSLLCVVLVVGAQGEKQWGAWPQSASALPFSREKLSFVLIPGTGGKMGLTES